MEPVWGSETLSLRKQKRLYRSRIPTIGEGKNHAPERGSGDSSPSLTQFQSTGNTGNKQDFPMRQLKLTPPTSLRPRTSAGAIIPDALTDVIPTVAKSFVRYFMKKYHILFFNIHPFIHWTKVIGSYCTRHCAGHAVVYESSVSTLGRI